MKQDHLTVLIVDDDSSIILLLHNVLEQDGFAVWQASSGEEAIELYRRRHADIDMVLLDVLMPRLSGPETLRQLQAINPGVRCCFMSGGFGTHTVNELLNLGAQRILSKPLDINSLATNLRAICTANHANHGTSISHST